MTSAPQFDAAAPEFTDEDVQVATDLLLQELSEPVTEIVTLTDEELLAIDGLRYEPLTPIPWVEDNAQESSQRTVATQAAMRSMIARGIVSSTAVQDPRRFEDENRSAQVIAVPAVHGTSVLRRTSDAVILAERHTDRGTAHSYFYVFHLDGVSRVLWEAFDAAGFHLFFLMDAATLPDQLIAFVDPEGVIGDTDGEVEEVPESEFAASATAQRAATGRAVTTVLVLRRESDEQESFTLVATPDAVELMEGDDTQPTPVRRVGELSRTTLSTLIGGLA